MAKPQFKKLFEEMLTEHEPEFREFTKIHMAFVKDPKKNRAEFNKQGEKIIEIIRHYESILCGRSESTGFGNYTSKLSEKLWNEVRKIYSEIDEIGVL